MKNGSKKKSRRNFLITENKSKRHNTCKSLTHVKSSPKREFYSSKLLFRKSETSQINSLMMYLKSLIIKPGGGGARL